MEEFRSGKVVPFLGAGASGYRSNTSIGLPTGAELSLQIAEAVEFPAEDDRDSKDLPKVASYYVDKVNREALRRRLRNVFVQPDGNFNEVHRLLAEVANDNLFIITTNYDTMLENAFRSLGKPYEVMVYGGDNPEYGNSILLWQNEAQEPEKLKPSALDPDSLEHRNIIYKMHGSVHPDKEIWDSFVITEDDYVTFLSTKNAIPSAVKIFLANREFLFLGYGLRDWNTRVLLRQASERRRATETERRSWAIQLEPSRLEHTLWNRRKVDIYSMDLDEFIQGLREKGGL